MAEIANWNGHKFVVKPKLIKSFEELTIKGACETKDKSTNNQKYVERKAGEATQVTFTVMLNALTGCKDVFAEAMKYVEEAWKGATDYLYLGSSKIIDAKLMLVVAEVVEIVTMPGMGNVWISCKVKLTMKQGTGNGNETAPSAGSGGPPWTAVYYYSASSGAVQKVSATSNVSYADALKKAQARIPANALWSGPSPKKATNQDPKLTDKALEAARAREQGRKASQGKKQKIGLDARTENQNKLTMK